MGIRLGFGAPARATRATTYLGAELRWPLTVDRLHLQADLGVYNIHVHTQEMTDDAYSGPQLLDIDYRTRVIPLEANLVYQIPLDLGELAPFAGVGLGFYMSWRVDEQGRQGGASLGTQWFVGADYPLPTGRLAGSLSWNGARERYGNLTVTGEDAKETLATVRLNVAYLHSF